jgi:GTPase SAR1 family protein
MQAKHDLVEGRARLATLLQQFPADHARWNEAENRFQFVDELLTKCLGWQKPHMAVEEFDDAGGRADYILGNPAKGVLEAKKPALIWEDVPAASKNKVRSIAALCLSSKTFKDAVTQIVPYCALKGAPLAVVCNGPQMAIFQGILVGNEPLRGECFLFNGFEDNLKGFALLWKLLSPEGVTENRALNELSKHRIVRLPPKASTAIPEPMQFRYRSALQDELRSLGSILLEEIEDNPQLRESFYRECYVPLEANNRHLNLSKQIIQRRYERVAQDGSSPAPLFSTGQSRGLPDTVFLNTGSKPLVVLGDVGVGKTSFFENLSLSVDGNKAGSAYLINIDLGTKATLASSLKEYVVDAIPRILRDRYGVDIDDADFVQSVYDIDLKQFDRGIHGQLKKADPDRYSRERFDFLVRKVSNRAAHIQVSLSHISKGQKKRVVLIIDNADQRTFEDQQAAFLIAQEMAATRAMYVFVALRPSTFFLSKTTGALSAYQNKILTISPPPADVVIEKRISFALRVAEGQIAPGGLDGIRLNLPSIVSFLRATLRSVRSNDEIRQFLSNITGGNTRSVIELITTFVGSPNVDARKIVNIETKDGNYHIPFHEFTKHALLGEYTYFNPQSSLVACNVYDVSNADPREHFLRTLIVAYLSAGETIRDKDGYVDAASIVTEMGRNGFTEFQTSGALRHLAAKKLIETPYSHFKEVDTEAEPTNFIFRATSVGIYHVRNWAYGFSFLDAVSTDTPIFDEDIRTTVSRLGGSVEIRERLVKAGAFKEYLLRRWHLANLEAPYLDFPTLLSSQDRQFQQVGRAVTKMTGFRQSYSR